MSTTRILYSTLVLLIVSISGRLQAQTFYKGSEWGASFGASQYFGDLNDSYGFRNVRPSLGLFGRFHVNNYIAVRTSFNATRLGYKDSYSSEYYNQRRNLSFQTNILEAAIQAEFNFFRFATGEFSNRFTPYLTCGIGGFYYNPYAYFNDRKYYLRKLGTEGQNAGFDDRKYSHFSVCVPIGMGFKYWLRPGLNFGFELANRLTFTDYIDDVSTSYVGSQYFPTDPQAPNPAHYLQDPSAADINGQKMGRTGKQRGNSATKDQYFMGTFTLSFQLKTYKCPNYMNAF